MILGMKKNNKLTDGERQKFEDMMETNDRKPKAEEYVIYKLKKDYTKTKRLKDKDKK